MSGRRLSRRSVLAGAAASLALSNVAACQRGRGQRLEIVVVWSGKELERFREVIDLFERQHDEIVDVTTGGDDIDQFLSARIEAGNSPDIAVIPRPGLLPCYAQREWIHPVGAIVPGLPSKYTAPWLDILRVPQDDGSRPLYGVWVKAAHKSLFWKRPDSPVTGSATWEDFVDQMRELAREDGPAPLALGAADGWVLTDMLENLLVSRTGPDTYRDLAIGRDRWDDPTVVEAFHDLFDLWSIGGRLFPHGAGRTLLTQWEESAMQAFALGSAHSVFEGDFLYPVAERFARKADPPIVLGDHGFEDIHVDFPSATSDPSRQPLLVGGDFAVLMQDSTAARELLGWLTVAENFGSWLEVRGFLMPHKLAQYPDDRFEGLLSAALVDEDARLRFDLSDLMPAPLSGADGLGLWKVMQDFLRAATRRGADADDVVDEATGRLNDASRRYLDAQEAGDACG